MLQSNDVQLPFEEGRQQAILGHIILNPAFFKQCINKIQPSWFNNPLDSTVYAALQDFYQRLKRVPTRSEVKVSTKLGSEIEPQRTNLHRRVDLAIIQAEEFKLDLLRTELTSWYHARLIRESVAETQHHFNQGRFSEAATVMKQKSDLIWKTSFDSEEALSFENPQDFLSKQAMEFKAETDTGLPELDAALRPDGDFGPSFVKGDTTVLMAPSNVGKTTSMITIAIHNALRRDKKVLFLTHEGSPEDIREKMFCCALGRTKAQIMAMCETQQGLRVLNEVSSRLRKNLTYIPYNRPGMVVEDVISLIRRKQEESAISDPTGQGYHLLVDDYPAKLSTQLAKRGNLAKRNIDDVVYDHFVQVALEYKFHSLVAIQVNRQGSKENNEGNRLLTMEDVSESWGVMCMANTVITMNRDDDAKRKNRLIYYVCKSRSSDTGRAVVARSNFPCCVAHHKDYGATWYRGSSNLGDKLDDFLALRKGQEITFADMKSAT